MNLVPDNSFVIEAAINRCISTSCLNSSQVIAQYQRECTAIQSKYDDVIDTIFKTFDSDGDKEASVKSVRDASVSHIADITTKHKELSHAIHQLIEENCRVCDAEISTHITEPVYPDVPRTGRVTSAGQRRNAMVYMYNAMKNGIIARISVTRRHLISTYVTNMNEHHSLVMTQTTLLYASIVDTLDEEADIVVDTCSNEDVSMHVRPSWKLQNHDLVMQGAVSVRNFHATLSRQLNRPLGIINLPPPRLRRVCVHCNTVYSGTQNIANLKLPYSKGMLWSVFRRTCPQTPGIRCCDMLTYRRCYDVTLITVSNQPAEMNELEYINDDADFARAQRKAKKTEYDHQRYLSKRAKSSHMIE